MSGDQASLSAVVGTETFRPQRHSQLGASCPGARLDHAKAELSQGSVAPGQRQYQGVSWPLVSRLHFPWTQTNPGEGVSAGTLIPRRWEGAQGVASESSPSPESRDQTWQI